MATDTQGRAEAPDSSEALARAAATGDQRALGTLIGRHRDEAYRVALRLSGSPADADEVLQAALEKVVRNISRFDPARPFRPWLLRIVVNQSRSSWRMRRLKSLFLGDWDEVTPTTSPAVRPDGELSRKELRSALERALGALTREQREAFVLKHVEGLTYEEIAAVTGDSVGSLRVRTHRARATVLEWCRAHGVTPSYRAE